MKSVQCSACFKQSCVGGGHQEKSFCPTNNHPEVFAEARKVYARDSETRLMAKNSAIMESTGYIIWPRLKDIIEFSKSMKYNKITVLFCPDLWRETKKACSILSENGFTIATRVCRIDKTNPQPLDAFISEINELSHEIVINSGLCVPFESEVLRLSKVPVSTFIARDKKLNNYPALAVYASNKWRDWAKEVYRDKLDLK